MVEKNQTVSKTKNIPVISLGDGDVIISSCFNEDEKYSGITFTNDVPCEIGIDHPEHHGKTTDELKPNAMLIFTKVESIDVLTDALKEARESLQEIS